MMPSAPTGAVVATAGESCSEQDRMACGGHASSQVLKCDGKQWQPAAACPEGRRCDTRPAAPAGTCKPVADGCKDRRPGDAICREQSVERCGPDLLTLESVQQCTGDAPLCRDGACTCPTRCSGRCVDTKLDVANCGACGHSCMGTLCNAGICEPTELARDLGRIADIATDGAFVYVAMDDDLYRVLKEGGSPLMFFPNCYDISFIRDDYLYTHCAELGFVRLSVLGGKPPEVLSESTVDAPALYGDTIYFANADYGISRMAVSGGPATVVVPMVEGRIRRLAADETSIYWTALVGLGAGWVMRLPASAATAPTRIAPDQDDPYWVFATGKDVFWANIGDTGSLMTVALPNGPATRLYMGSVASVAIDDTAFYWAGRGKVGRVKFGTADAFTLATPIQATHLTVDDAFAYWVEVEAGRSVLKRVAK